MSKTRQTTLNELKKIEMGKERDKESAKNVKEVKGPYELPEGWRWVRLGDIVEINKSSVNPQKDFPEKKFIYIDISGVESGTGRIKEVKILLGKEAPSRARRLVHSGDILMSTVRPNLKEFAIVPPEYDRQVCSTGFAVLTPKENVLSKFVLFALFSDVLVDQCNRMMLGAHYPALTSEQVKSLKVPLPFKNNKPDLEEQKRIVAKIEELFSKIDRIKELRRQAKEQAENLLKAALHHVFSRADEKGWKWVRLGDIAEIIMGQSPPSETYNIEGKGLPFYQGKADFGERYPIPRVYCIAPSKIAEIDDILISVRAPVGPVNIVNHKCGIGRGLAAIRVKKVFNLYAFYWLKYFEDRWEAITKRGTTFEAITKSVLLRHKLPLPFKNNKPDLEEQKRIAAYLDEIAEKQRKLLELYERTERELEELKNAILDKAFRGQL